MLLTKAFLQEMFPCPAVLGRNSWLSRCQSLLGRECTQVLVHEMNDLLLPCQSSVTHTCNPSYSEGRDQDCHLRPVRANSSRDPISKIFNTKNDCWSDSRCRPWVQTPPVSHTQKKVQYQALIFNCDSSDWTIPIVLTMEAFWENGIQALQKFLSALLSVFISSLLNCYVIQFLHYS
jgi:hypothetical protein